MFTEVKHEIYGSGLLNINTGLFVCPFEKHDGGEVKHGICIITPIEGVDKHDLSVYYEESYQSLKDAIENRRLLL